MPQSAEENFRISLVGDVLRLIYPGKTDAKVGAICGFSDRAARDVMNGKVPMPAVLLVAIMSELTRRPPKPRRSV